VYERFCFAMELSGRDLRQHDAVVTARDVAADLAFQVSEHVDENGQPGRRPVNL